MLLALIIAVANVYFLVYVLVQLISHSKELKANVLADKISGAAKGAGLKFSNAMNRGLKGFKNTAMSTASKSSRALKGSRNKFSRPGSPGVEEEDGVSDKAGRARKHSSAPAPKPAASGASSDSKLEASSSASFNAGVSRGSKIPKFVSQTSMTARLERLRRPTAVGGGSVWNENPISSRSVKSGGVEPVGEEGEEGGVEGVAVELTEMKKE